MLIYLLKSGLCLLVLFSFYKLFLENENFHKIKRIYLLATLFLAFSLPFITFTYEVEIPGTSAIQGFEELPIIDQESKATTTTTNWQFAIYGIIGVYLSGFIFFAFRFYKNLRSILGEARKNERLTELNYIYILLGQKLDPHSFFNYIFLNKTEFRNDKISKAVIEHEKAHVDQKHSLDVVFIEILQVIFWFNPIFKWIKKSVKLNHEFLADQEVLGKEFNALEYSNILFNYSSGYHHNSLSSPINHSLIKKRIIMITKDFSFKKLLIRTGLFIPVLGCCIFFFNNDIVAKPVYNYEGTANLPGIIAVPVEEQTSVSNFIANSISDLQEPNLKIVVEGEKVWVNGKMTKLNDFARTVDNITSGLNEDDLKDLSIHMKTSNSDSEIIETLDSEFAKTRLSRVSGRGILPPPPPMPPKPGEVPLPPEVGDEIINAPPAPPAPPAVSAAMNSKEAEDVHRERAKEWKRLKDEQRNLIQEEQRKIREIEKQLLQDEKLSEAEKDKLRQEVERKEAESQRKINDIERKRIAIEREHVAMERKQIEMEKSRRNVPAAPPPPKIKEDVSKYPRDAIYYLNDEEISYTKAIEVIKEGKATQVNIRKNSSDKDEVKIYF